VWQLSQREPSLKELVDVVGFVVGHVLHLEMDIEPWILGMPTGAMP